MLQLLKSKYLLTYHLKLLCLTHFRNLCHKEFCPEINEKKKKRKHKQGEQLKPQSADVEKAPSLPASNAEGQGQSFYSSLASLFTCSDDL